MKRIITSIFLVTSISILSGCASHKYSVKQPVASKFSQFENVYIAEFKSNLNTEKAMEVAKAMPGDLLKKLNERNNDPEKQRLFKKISKTPIKQGNTLVTNCVLTSYEEGSRAARYLLGFGAGKAYASVSCKFVDFTTNKLVSEANFDGELSIGFFGGDAVETTGAIITSIIEFIEKNYS